MRRSGLSLDASSPLSISGPEADVALDTEADSFHHYFEKVCLLQLAWDGTAHLVDPLAPLDVPALLARLAPRRLLMHGADYDLRLLFRGYGFRATSLFDTMLAAQLLGEKEIGLAALLSARAGVTLDKTHQRADWSERPLTPPMVAYAAADVLHLAALVESLTRDLEAKGRLAWHAEECARLAATVFPAGREADPENDWRIKGTNALTDRERAFARALWEAREARARALDLPPFRVLTNERLLLAAKPAAAGERDLTKLFPGPRPLPDPFATAVGEALARAAALAPADWPKARRGERIEVGPRARARGGDAQEVARREGRGARARPRRPRLPGGPHAPRRARAARTAVSRPISSSTKAGCRAGAPS